MIPSQSHDSNDVFRMPARPLMQPVPALLPDVPCSVNGFFEVEGYGRLQATGRGWTPEEAAENLIGTMDAVRQRLAPVEPSSVEKVGTTLACWLTKAINREDWGLVERLSKGAAIVLAGHCEPGNTPQSIAVKSQSATETTWYEVELHKGTSVCSCKDYEHSLRKLVEAGHEASYACKHICAAALWQRCA